MKLFFKLLVKRFSKSEDGWTYIETLVVIAIILILTATVGFASISALDKARTAAAKTQIESFSTALEAYYMDCGFYPTTDQGLMALRKKPELSPSSDNWSGPYLYKEPPKDPWGRNYEYVNPAPDGSLYGIRSYGADGIEGGEGKNADIRSWD